MRLALFLLFVFIVLAVSFVSAEEVGQEQAQLHVVVKVINDDFGTVTDNFIYWVPSAIRDVDYGSRDSIIPVHPGSYEIYSFSPPTGYSTSFDGCSGTINVGETKTCTITINDPPLLAHKGEWCYQESADKATECGGLGTGKYQSENAPNYWMDENWDWSHGQYTNVFAQSHSGHKAIDENLYVNYSKPVRALNSSVIKIKESTDGYIDRVTDSTYQIPQLCFDQSVLSFKFTAPIDGTIAWCWDGKEWKPVRTMQVIDSWVGIVEEAMIWDMAPEIKTRSGTINPNVSQALPISITNASLGRDPRRVQGIFENITNVNNLFSSNIKNKENSNAAFKMKKGIMIEARQVGKTGFVPSASKQVNEIIASVNKTSEENDKIIPIRLIGKNTLIEFTGKNSQMIYLN